MSERRLDDPEYVRAQYADESGLAARIAIYDEPGAQFDLELEALAQAGARRILEVGAGDGSFAARVRDSLAAEVVTVDTSARMVELQRRRALDARTADVQALPFADAEFDALVANYMLYHVADLDRALSEIVRVLRRGGLLVAITNGVDHLHEMWQPLGRDIAADLSFNGDSGHAILEPYFAEVVRHEVRRSVTLADEAVVRRYLDSSDRWRGIPLPPYSFPLQATTASVLFVATRAS